MLSSNECPSEKAGVSKLFKINRSALFDNASGFKRYSQHRYFSASTTYSVQSALILQQRIDCKLRITQLSCKRNLDQQPWLVCFYLHVSNEITKSYIFSKKKNK